MRIAFGIIGRSLLLLVLVTFLVSLTVRQPVFALAGIGYWFARRNQ